jgi:uncharacterized protein (TIGR02594 family)
MDYPWIVEAKKHIGLKEIPGPKHNSVILGWLKSLKAWWSEDETPWCGTFVAHCMKTCNISVPNNWMRALAWAEWGVKLSSPVNGCVVVFKRAGGGHVGFVMGQTTDGFLSVLGGNQGNSVTVAKFDKGRVVGYYWPKEVSMPSNGKLNIVSNSGTVSTNEA